MNYFKKILIITFSFLYLTACGYTPIFVKKDLNFGINSIKFEGDRKIKSIILSGFAPYKNKEENKNNYDLIVKSKKEITTVSKNIQGEAQIFKISISTNLQIFLNGELINSKNFTNTTTYDNEEKKLRLKEVENQNIAILSSKLSDQILLTLKLADE